MSYSSSDYTYNSDGQSIPPKSGPTLGGLIVKSVIRGAAFSIGMAIAGPIGGIAGLVLTGGGGDTDGGGIDA